jgi:predicted DNA-binding transcriptional regulator YafY
MNRTDRLLAIILELQAKGWQRAEDLAATFEVGKRTIYRDMLALLESGVPILSVPGQGYSLIEGYFLPPVRFSTDEALLLLLGANFAAQNFDAQYRLAARGAERKIRAILPDPFRQEVDALQDSIRFIANPSSATHQEVLQALRRAIIQSRRVQFSYHARFGEAASPREADPYALIYVNQVWYLVAYCHLRHDIRHFRLERIEALNVTTQSFRRPPGFSPSSSDPSDRTLRVQILVRPAAIRWMRENPSFFQTDAAEQPDGLLVTLHVRHEEEVLQWLLGWGANVLVLEPASLRQRIIAEAEATLRQYRPDPAEL